MVVANAVSEVLDAVRGYVWVLLAAVVLWRLFPVIRKRIESEDFTVEIAGQKVSFQSASQQSQRELDDLRSQIIALTERLDGSTVEAAAEVAMAPEADGRERARILWVDDRPENNAFLIKSLTDRGADVVECVSTDDALVELKRDVQGFDVVISDIVRRESDRVRPRAGVDLVRRMRDADVSVPVVIYASQEAIARDGEKAIAAGAVDATASPTELLSMLRIGPTTAFEASVAKKVRRRLDATAFPIRRTVDYVAHRDHERIGIEIKNWSSTPTREEFERVLRRVDDAHQRHGFDRILMITRANVSVPEGVDLPPWLTVLTDDELDEPLPF